MNSTTLHSSHSSRRMLSIGALQIATATLFVALLPLSAQAETTTFDAKSLLIVNLIGEIEVVGHSGDKFEVETQILGEDADQVELETEEGRSALLLVKFPLDEERDYVYPKLGRRSRTSFSISKHSGSGTHRGWLHKLFGGRLVDGIDVRGSGSGMEVWADIKVRVPEGGKLRVDHGVGNVVAKNVNGELVLETRSGSVDVETSRGDLLVDTGSGHVTIFDVEGELVADTGSGHVEIEKVSGPMVNVDTGSGHVQVTDVECEELRIDTGSGRVKALDIGTDEANIDTGSGSVTIEFVRMGDGDFIIDTGSGGIDILFPEDASADILAETGSGGIRLDLVDPRIHHRDRDEMAVSIGDGDARVRLDTGSGGISIAQR